MYTLKDLNDVSSVKTRLAYFCITLSFVFAIFMYYSSERKVEKAREQAYILKSTGEVYIGEASGVRENRKVEVRDHISVLHKSLFTLQPNEKHIQEQIQGKAYYLGDNSIIEFDKRRANQGFYNDLISTGSSVQFKIDSIKINMQKYPYYAVCWGRQRIIREEEIIYHSVVSQNELINGTRTNENSHGLSVNFKILTYKEIYRQKR